MGYYIKYLEMHEYEQELEVWIKSLKEIIQELKVSFSKIAAEESLEGDTVNAIQNYVEQYHLRVIEGLDVLLDELYYTLRQYLEDYTSNIDASEDTILCEDAFHEYLDELTGKGQSLDYYQEQIETIVNYISFANVKKPDPSIAQTIRQNLIQRIQNLAENVYEMENGHLSDTDGMEELSDSMEEFVKGYCLQTVKEKAADSGESIESVTAEMEETVKKIGGGEAAEGLDALILRESRVVKELKKQLTAGDFEEYVTEEMLIACGWSEEVISEEMLWDLNRVLNKYEINMPERIIHFLTQCTVESGGGSKVCEYGSAEYFADKSYDTEYRGSGYIQMTSKYKYQAFAVYLMLEEYPQLAEYSEFKNPANHGAQEIEDSYFDICSGAQELGIDISEYMKIVDIGTEYVGANYAWESAGFVWMIHGINEALDNGATVDEVSEEITGSSKEKYTEPRRKAYAFIMDADIFNLS